MSVSNGFIPVVDKKHRPGSQEGCPLVNLSSPWHTVEPRPSSADLYPAGKDRQALGPTASALCLDVPAAPSGQASTEKGEEEALGKRDGRAGRGQRGST